MIEVIGTVINKYKIFTAEDHSVCYEINDMEREKLNYQFNVYSEGE